MSDPAQGNASASPSFDAQERRDMMREHSGAEGKNNNRNPSLKEQEEAKGRSGEAITGSKAKGKSPSRKSTAQA